MRGPLLAVTATVLVVAGWAFDNVPIGVAGACLALFSVSMSMGDLLHTADAEREAIGRVIARHEHRDDR